LTFPKVMTAVLLVLAGAGESWASLLVYEDFNYSPAGAQLLGANGGTGFSTAWQTAASPANSSANYVLNSGTLSFGPLATNGQSTSSAAIAGIGGLLRSFTQTFGADNTTVYMSLLLRPEGTLNVGYSFGYFGVFLQSSANHIFVGKPGGGDHNDWALEAQGGGGQVSTGVAAVVGQTTFLVVRADFAAGPDAFTLYLNPTPGGTEPLTGTVKNDMDAGAITGVEIFSAGAYSLDEIRIGDTFADVTPAPEPSTAIMILLAGATLVILNRSRIGGVGAALLMLDEKSRRGVY
jgi:hypothetical protein